MDCLSLCRALLDVRCHISISCSSSETCCAKGLPRVCIFHHIKFSFKFTRSSTGWMISWYWGTCMLLREWTFCSCAIFWSDFFIVIPTGPNSPLSTSSLTPLTPSRESKHSSASPLASTPKRSPSSCSLPELGSVSSSPLHRTNLASSEKKRKTGVGTSSRGSSLSPVPLDHLSASPILPAAPSTKQPGLNRSFLSLPVSSSSRAPSGSLSHSATNLPALGVASSSSHLSALTERPRAMSSDQLHLIPDYEKGELLMLNVEHPTNLPRMGSPPPMKTVDSMSSLSSISLDRSPPAHEQRLCSHRKSSRKYSAREVLHVMAKSPNLDHSLSGRVFQIMVRPAVLWTHVYGLGIKCRVYHLNTSYT